MANNSLVRDLTGGSVARTMIFFSAPLFFSSLLQTAYNLADMIIVGQFVGKEGLSAASIGGDVLLFLSFVAMGFSNAGQVMISQLTGAGRREDTVKLIGSIFTFLFGCAAVFTGLGLLFQKRILGWVNTPPESLEHTIRYTGICMAGLVFVYGYNAISAILRGMGDSKHPFYFIALAASLNVALDLLFIAVFGWGIAGAALATVVSQAVSFLWAVGFLHRRRAEFGFDFKLRSFAIKKEVFVPFLKLGVPMMLQMASIDFSKLFVNSWVNSYGVLASAVTGIGARAGSVVNVVNVSLATAGSSMIGQAIGAEKYDRVPRVVGVSFALNIFISLAMCAVVLVYPRAVFGAFTSDAELLEYSLTYVPVLLLLDAGSALRPPMSSLINGSGNFKLNLLVALLDGIFMRIGLSVVMGVTLGMGVYGFWYGNALASFTPFVIGGAYYLTGRWRTRKYLLGA